MKPETKERLFVAGVMAFLFVQGINIGILLCRWGWL